MLIVRLLHVPLTPVICSTVCVSAACFDERNLALTGYGVNVIDASL